MSIGQNIKTVCKVKGMTQADLKAEITRPEQFMKELK